ncbi:MAG TPA: penicillin-binding protein 2 [Nitrolancea sp.]|nr:penicillin-binding protein 2 [Nitrolancea sp.]
MNQNQFRIPRRRIYVLFIGFVIFSLAISYRIVTFQVVHSQQLSQEAVASRLREDVVPARRGEILDAEGRPLATNIPADQLAAIVQQVKDPKQTAAALAPIIGRSAEDIEAAITAPGKEWVVLKTRLSPEASQQITDLKLPGLVLSPEPRRIYPNDDFASQVLGFVNYNNDGSYGIEGKYNNLLSGTPGKLIGERDEQGNVIALANSVYDPPKDGADLVLTIDSSIQWIVEQALDQAMKDQQASGGTIIVENPKTGAILAMASRGSFDPNAFETVEDPSVFVNPAISDIYEPGSTFKPLGMSLALDQGLVSPDTTYDGGSYRILPGGAKVTNALGAAFGPETMTQVLEHSSNLGMMHVADLIGEQRFYQGLEAFGIGQPTGVDLQGESGGILPLPGEPDWSAANFYTNTFGQGLAVTPLQLLNAICVLANGGELMQPYVVQQIRNADGTVKQIQPQVEHRVISPQTSRTITDMLTAVMKTTYTRFAIPGYDVAAKTGTAQIPSPNGGYDPNSTIGSVIGYGPSSDPQFAVLVKIDRPQNADWGEEAAGPAFKQVMQQLFLLKGIPPTEATGTAP